VGYFLGKRSIQDRLSVLQNRLMMSILGFKRVEEMQVGGTNIMR
jgi:hypothetical protein